MIIKALVLGVFCVLLQMNAAFGQIKSLKILFVPMAKDMMLTDNYTARVFERQRMSVDTLFNSTYNEIKNIKEYSIYGEEWHSALELDQFRGTLLNDLEIQNKKAYFQSKDSTKKGAQLHKELFNGKRYHSRIFADEFKEKLFAYSTSQQFDFVLVVNSFDVKTRKPFETWAHVSLHAEVYRSNGQLMFGGKSFYPFRITKKMFANPLLYLTKRGIQLYIEHLVQLMIVESK